MKKKQCKKCNQEKSLSDFRYGRRTCLLCESIERKTIEYRQRQRDYRRKRSLDPSYREKINEYQNSRHQQKILNESGYREKIRLISKERRRLERAKDPKWIHKQIERMIREMEKCNRIYEANELRKEIEKRKKSPAYKIQRLNTALKYQRNCTSKLTDGYIRRKLCHRTILERKDIPVELILLKRTQMILGRTIREVEL